MLRKSSVVPAAILLAALLGSACGEGSPPAPSPVPTPVVPVPPPTPPTPPDLSALVGVWNITVRLTTVSGSGCVAETMQRQIGVPNAYSLLITNNGHVTLASASGDYECSFTPSADSSGFTTYGVGGYFDCKDPVRAFRCDDGTEHGLFSWGQDISGRVSGTEINGAWDASWEDMGSGLGVEAKAQFTGTR